MEKQKRNKIIVLSIIFIVLSITCFFSRSINCFISIIAKKEFNIIESKNNLLIHFVDVGQGDAVAVNLPNGEILLIDTGPENRNVDYINYLKEKVLNFKKDLTIDYLILTHADSDHIGGTLKLLQTFNVEKVYMPIVFGNSATFEETFLYIEANCDYEIISRETEFKVENCEIKILGLYEFNDTNKSSTVVKLTYLNNSFLFMADADFQTEEMLMNEYSENLDCDVLKVAHHGSKESTSKEFLNFVTPEYSIISVGINSYGHPNDILLNRLTNIGSEIYRTDINGDILFVVGNEYELSAFKNNFIIINNFLDYKILILVIDCIIAVNVFIILFKKTKKKTK